VSYEGKRNRANGEGNRDGTDDNASWHCGIEGETDDAAVTTLRLRQVRNALALLMLSRGVPMLLAGDEVLRTQAGNNNAYCQDNPLSWFDWGLVERHGAMLRYVRELIAFRRRHPCLTLNRFFDGSPVAGRGLADVSWHGVRLDEPPWRGGPDRVLGFTVAGLSRDEEDLHVIANMADRGVTVSLPAIPGRRWHLALDTTLPPPDDIVERGRQAPLAGGARAVGPRSVVVLEARA
jgi:glycogen operon protein